MRKLNLRQIFSQMQQHVVQVSIYFMKIKKKSFCIIPFLVLQLAYLIL